MSRQRQLYKHSLKFTEVCEITQDHYDRLNPGQKKAYRKHAKAKGLPSLWTYSKSDLRSMELNKEDYE